MLSTSNRILTLCPTANPTAYQHSSCLEIASLRDMFHGTTPTVYPQGFSQEAVHCQALFIHHHCLRPARQHFERLFQQPDTVQTHKFQAYSTYKTVVRSREHELTVTRGLTTVVVGLPDIGVRRDATMQR